MMKIQDIFIDVMTFATKLRDGLMILRNSNVVCTRGFEKHFQF